MDTPTRAARGVMDTPTRTARGVMDTPTRAARGVMDTPTRTAHGVMKGLTKYQALNKLTALSLSTGIRSSITGNGKAWQ